MSAPRRLLNNCLPVLPFLLSIIAFILNNPYISLIGSFITAILALFILEGLSRKQRFNIFVFEVPDFSVNFLEFQFRLLDSPITRFLDPFTTFIIVIYIYRCRRLRQVGPPKKLEPSPPLKITLTLRCPKCGTELLTDAEFCPQCGTKLPAHSLAK